MTNPQILLATLARRLSLCGHAGAGVSRALHALPPRAGAKSGAWFICGHLVGDVVWGALAVAAIVGANTLGPTLFEALGFVCGLYLIYLGARAVMTRKDAPPKTIGAERPLATGMAFGLTNPEILSGGARDVLGDRRALYRRAESRRRAADVRRGLRWASCSPTRP